MVLDIKTALGMSLEWHSIHGHRWIISTHSGPVEPNWALGKSSPGFFFHTLCNKTLCHAFALYGQVKEKL